MAAKDCLTAERLRELLDYDPATGVFTWRVSRPGGVKRGDTAGCMSDTGCGKQYRRIRIDGVLYHAHRLAWFHVHGAWPVKEIDHRRDDSMRLDNLREATRQQNMGNMSMRVRNTSGFKGVTRRGNNRWIAQIHRDKAKAYLGIFRTPQEAAAAYDCAALERFGEFAKTNAMLGLL